MKLSSDPTIGREGKLQRFLRILNKVFSVRSSMITYILVVHNQLGCTAVLRHKLKSESDKLTFRPIVSSIGAYNYKLAKFLTSMLDDVIPKDHCTKDSFSFCKKIKKLSSTNKFLISYDICSLFTRFPLNETIELAVKLIFDNNPNIKITKKDLKYSEFTTSETHILFDGNYYDQIDGVAMGLPLGPVLDNLFTKSNG